MKSNIGRAFVALACASGVTVAGASAAAAAPTLVTYKVGDGFEVVHGAKNLFAVYLDGTRRGDTYLSYRVARKSTGTRSESAWKLKDTREDGYLVHGRHQTMVNAGYCLTPKYTSCDAKYYAHGNELKTLGWGSATRSSWIYRDTSVGQTADYARLSGRMCITRPNWPDKCSDHSPSSGWKY